MVSHPDARRNGVSPELTIVIPAHNEEHRIGPTLRDYLAYFNAATTEIIVVLNGCTDRTAKVVTGVQRRIGANLHVIDIPEPIGKGGAVKAGFLAARGQTVGFVDADGATTAEEFERIVQAIDRADGAIASRWISGARVYNRTSPMRKLTSLGFVVMVKLLFRLPYHDTQCGAKVFHRHVIDAIAGQLTTQDMTFDVELLVRARAAGYRIIEVATIWTDQTSSTVPSSPLKLGRTSFRMLNSLIKLARLSRREHLI